MTDFGPAHAPTDPPSSSVTPVHDRSADYGQSTQYGRASDSAQLTQHERRREPRVDVLDWCAIAVPVVAFVFSFFGYFSYHAKAAESRTECTHLGELPAEARGLAHELCSGATVGAWHGFVGWFGVLLGLVAAGLVAYTAYGPRVNRPMLARRLAFGAAGLALLATLIAFVVIPDWPALQSFAASVGGSYSHSQYDKNVSNGHGFSYWIVLIALAVLTGTTFVQLRRTDDTAPTPPPGGAPGSPEAYRPPTEGGAPQAPPADYRSTWTPPPPQDHWTPPGPISSQ